jgi:hypothetical protein
MEAICMDGAYGCALMGIRRGALVKIHRMGRDPSVQFAIGVIFRSVLEVMKNVES